jgi:hypothetical protein
MGSIGDGGTISKNVTPGTYTTTETVPYGWELLSIVCDDPASTGNKTTKTATYVVTAGKTVTCTFTDAKKDTLFAVCAIGCGKAELTSSRTFSGVIAVVLDLDFKATAASYTTTIDWGDGSPTSPGTVSGKIAVFGVSGTHTYAADGTYTVKVKVVQADGRTASTTCLVQVKKKS